MISSTLPRFETATVCTAAVITSPVASTLERRVVESIRAKTIKNICMRRRGMFRMPILKKIAFVIASKPTPPMMIKVITSNMVVRVSSGIPKSCVIYELSSLRLL